MKSNYTPNPIEASGKELPDELKVLVEKMAENVHDIWAKNRIEQGWTYGATRNDALKQHPCLVAYKDLPEEEREYDRKTAIGTIDMILQLGFKIVKS